MVRELDIDAEERIDPNFKKSIQGITSKLIVEKIKYPSPLHTFHFDGFLDDVDVNTGRFMMEGLGFSSKYWLCTGPKTLESLMRHNIEREPYSELIKQSGRKDVLCLKELPLFYTDIADLGDCLLMVSDVSKGHVRMVSFIDTRKDMDRADLKRMAEKVMIIRPPQQAPSPPDNVGGYVDGDVDEDNDIPF